ncbi:M23 family metallopeptidase [Corynebacterium senegalense]|uniref:M23 family metallopeptidase n=1 Tax=Corynebacterium senegalense TaxID=2080750 RepID=UPI000E20AB6D|nr:peptidoglycan DD-metalloendopeptidase family protein [Corynebacterium senegalense]
MRQPWSAPLTILLALAALLSCVFCAPPAAAWVDPSTGSPSASRVTRAPSIPAKNWMPGHRGVDLALSPGGDVRAAGDGMVAFVGVVAGVPSVSIEHDGGIRTTYLPVHARVRAGEEVTEGQVVGTLGRSPDHEGLHWGALTGPDAYINPLTLLAAPTIRLKPVGAE